MIYQRKPIPGYPGYEADTNGNIWSCLNNHGKATPNWHTLKGLPRSGKGGYLCVWLSGDRQLVHRLILETFVGPRPAEMDTCHNNGNPADNRLENLRWDTRKANLADQIKHGTARQGERHGRSKLKDSDIPLIRELLENSRMTKMRIGEIFGVSAATIYFIANGSTWKHVSLYN